MAKWLLVLSLIAARPAYAGDGLDVKDWLSRPGVKLLAVEFYASWCGPCKKAVPQWKALHEKYRDQGLRLVVVSVQDPDGACVNPGWNPDDVVCDAEGRLAEAWGVGDKLPAAFLWSWRGPLLVRKGHVEEVERQVEEELGRLPRVTLDEGMDGQVRELLRTELARTGKVDVVAGADEEAALAAIRRKSHEVQFSDRSACKLGQRLAANSLLKASFVEAGNGKRLLVQIFSAESGCLNASAGVFWNVERPDMSVAEAVAELVNNLRVAVDLPGGVVAIPRVPKDKPSGPAKERDMERLNLALWFSEGLLAMSDELQRTNVTIDVAFQVRIAWFRWEVLNTGVAFESPYAWTFGTAGIFDFLGLYLKAGLEVLYADANSYWGMRSGLGYALSFGQGWYLDLGANVRIIPGADTIYPVDGQLGVRYGF